MAKTAQGAALDRKKLMADPIMVTTIVLLITFLTLFILYPLAILLVDSVLMDGHVTLKIFQRIFTDPTSNFPTAITNTLRVGFVVGILSTIIGNYSPDAAVIITTHLIYDIEPVLDEFAFMGYGGQILLSGVADEVREARGKTLDELFREVFRCSRNA